MPDTSGAEASAWVGICGQIKGLCAQGFFQQEIQISDDLTHSTNNTVVLLEIGKNEGIGLIDPRALAAATFINPRLVRFAQNSVKSAFRNGSTIDNTVQGIRSGEVDPAVFPPIRLIEIDGDLYTLDNRRLVVFQKANIPVPYRTATSEEIASSGGKFSTRSGGISIQIRGTGEQWFNPDMLAGNPEGEQP